MRFKVFRKICLVVFAICCVIVIVPRNGVTLLRHLSSLNNPDIHQDVSYIPINPASIGQTLLQTGDSTVHNISSKMESYPNVGIKASMMDRLTIQNISSQQVSRHVVLLKVAKTASSTVQNIFFRFAEYHNLTVVLPHSKPTLRESCCSNVISFKNSLTEENIVKPPPGRHFEILCSHVIYNHTRMEKYFPENTAYIGIVREPIARLESAMAFFRLYLGINLTNVATDPFKYNSRSVMTTTKQFYKYPLHYMSNNRMAYEFGFPSHLFPSSIESYVEQTRNAEEIKAYLNKLDSEFKLIMITERFDESLVLMKRLLHWSIQDILYMDQNKAKREKRKFTTENDQKHIKQYLNLDVSLYEFAVNRFNEQVKKQGNDFPKEVEHFKRVRESVIRFCKRKPKDSEELLIETSVWNHSFNVRGIDCKLYQMEELDLTKRTRRRQYHTLIN